MKKGYLIRKSIAIIVGILSLLAVCGVFYPVKFMDIQFTPLLQRLIFDFSIIAAVLFGLVILATLLFGRFYCSTICPFGILQEFAGIIRGKKKNSLHKNYCPKNSRDKEREREFGVAYETAQPRVDLREQGKQAAENCFTVYSTVTLMQLLLKILFATSMISDSVTEFKSLSYSLLKLKPRSVASYQPSVVAFSRFVSCARIY